MKRSIFFLSFFFATLSLNAQSVYQHITNTGIYEFLDELASIRLIDLNTSVKPYSRQCIADALQVANSKKELLNSRQQKELDFYLKDFGKELNPDRNFARRFDAIFFKDSLFTLTINPVVGVYSNFNDSAFAYRRWVGAEMWGYIGKNFGFYTSLRDYDENYRFTDPHYVSRMIGGAYKKQQLGGEFSEMRGGVTYSWKWGSFGLLKDHIQWGSGYNGTNILGGLTPSFAMIKLQIKPVKWFELNYIHGWLVSQVIDSSRTYIAGTTKRNVFHPKYIAANFFTFTPCKNLNISLGNSIIYSDIEIQPGYLSPLFFYKSIDHHLNGMSNYTGQNSQMFFDISSKQIKNLHLFLTLFLDELSMKNAFDKNKHSNFYSLKSGFRLSDFPVKNLIFSTEYTRTNPLAYQHIISTTTYESNKYNLGHYLKDNTDEIYLSLSFKPVKALTLTTSYTHARKGPDYTALNASRLGLPFMETVEWEQKEIAFNVQWQIINDGYIFVGAAFSDTYDKNNVYTPSFLLGKLLNIRSGICFGL